MAIELKITVNHATDLAAEVQQLAQIIGVSPSNDQPVKTVPCEQAPIEVQYEMTEISHTGTEPAPTVSEKLAKSEKAVEDSKKVLNRKEQDEAVTEMIKAGAKDNRFELLTKGRQNEVTEALSKPTPSEPEKGDALDDMFSDPLPAKIVTREQVAELMAKISKGKDGNPVQERLLKIRAILVDNIPDGEEVKVRNIPEDKLATVYTAIEKVI